MNTLSFRTSGFVAKNFYVNLTNTNTGLISVPIVNLLFHPNNFSMIKTRVMRLLPNYDVNVILSHLVWRALSLKNLDIPVYWSTPLFLYSSIPTDLNIYIKDPMDPKALLLFNNLALELSNYPNFTNYALYVLMNNHSGFIRNNYNIVLYSGRLMRESTKRTYMDLFLKSRNFAYKYVKYENKYLKLLLENQK